MVPPEEYYGIVEKICHDHNILMISDDVLTGCGRTGTFFGFEHWDITPDIVALSKGISGGYTPMAAVLASEEVATPVLDAGGFMHGHTFAGNPLSAAICCEVLKIIREDKLVENSRDVGAYLHERLHDVKSRHTIIGDVRGRGLLAGIEYVADRSTKAPFPAAWMVAQQITVMARERGLLIYPRRSLWGLEGDHTLISPPLIITRAQVDEVIAIFEESLVALEKWIEGKKSG
jgi:adenosylmethionine-8-amino-7-oxononanoate aminotransferase